MKVIYIRLEYLKLYDVWTFLYEAGILETIQLDANYLYLI